MLGLYLPGALSSRVHNEVVAIDSFESKEFILLQFFIFDFVEDLRARSGQEVGEA